MLSSDAGVLLLREVERKLGIADRLAACLPDRRDPARIDHTIAEMIRFRIFAIERRFREVRRRTRPMGTFQDKTSMDRILFAVFIHENKAQGISTPFPLTQNS